jgi:ubiquinol-cytochrome c reductase iron-sulfur subunit
MSDQQVDQGRRTWVAIACGAGAVGGAAVAVPFVSTFQPSERARAAGAAVEVDISTLKPGEKVTVEWRGKPVWIIRRTPEQLDSLATRRWPTRSRSASPPS